MVQKTRLNNAPGGFGVPKGKPRRGPVRPHQGHPQVTPRGQNVTSQRGVPEGHPGGALSEYSLSFSIRVKSL